MRGAIFLFACICAKFGINVVFFFYVIIEVLIFWCQYLGPIVDKARKEKFERWLDTQITASGGESAHCLNKVLENAWVPLFPSNTSPWLSSILENFLKDVMPGFVKNIRVTTFLLGTKPPKVVQVFTEPLENTSSMTMTASVVLANDIHLSVNFTIFKIQFSLEVRDVVLYAPLKLVIETPEQANFIYLPPISCIACTAVEPVVWLSNKLILNGFSLGDLPLVNYLWSIILEYFIKLVISDDQCVVWDQVTNEVLLRNLKESGTTLGNRLFKNIAEKVPDAPLGRFSLPEESLTAFNETRRIMWERSKAIKLKDTQTLVYMSPNHGDDIQPFIPFDLEPAEYEDAEVQTEPEK